MKLYLKLFVIGLLILGLFATSALADKQYLGTSDWGKWYYSLGGQNTSRNGVVFQEIYCDIFLTDLGRSGFHTSAASVRVLYLIDCVGNRFASIGISYFDSSGKIIGEASLSETWTWEEIAPNTMADAMRKVSCVVPGIKF